MTPFRYLVPGLVAALFASLQATAADKAPNIVYILADQLRASALGYEGDRNVRTPQIDSLAKESANFRNAVSVCPVCTPYRAALLTGRFPTSTGMFLNDAYLPSEEVCLAEVLKEAGYDTAYIGKWHLDGHGRHEFVAPERRQGFDYWKAAECDHNYNRSHYYAGASPEKRNWEGYDAFAQTRDAERYLAEHAKGRRPFFLFLSYGIPHFPLGTAPADYKALYQPENIRFPANVPEELRTKQLRNEALGYYAHTSALDQCVGDVLKALDAHGLRENTIVVFTSDHGEMLGSHGIKTQTKQAPFNESARIPFLLRDPRSAQRGGRVVTTPLTTPDIMPTLLALAGVRIPQTVEGADLSPVVREGRELAGHVALFMNVSPFAGKAFGTAYRAIRTDRHTYVRSLEGPWLAFDETKDPLQMDNLVKSPSHAATTAALDERLNEELARIHDGFHPPQHYLDTFGFNVTPGQSVPYKPGAVVQSPKKRTVAAERSPAPQTSR